MFSRLLDLYSSRAERLAAQGVDNPRAPLTLHFTEDIPDVDVGEVSAALRQLKNGREVMMALLRIF